MNHGDELFSGRTLGRYELLAPIAEGATASVWAARTTGSHLERIVAVKAMLAELGPDIDAESMFLDEARLVARIRHPNVCAVLDLGEEGDALYIVMEWIDGEPLQVVMRKARGGLPYPHAVRIVKQAASGLHAAHELCDEAGHPLNLVHRDVSPQNVLVGYDGAVKVIDFGVAKAASNMQRTNVGQLKGKFPYMAPEQALGDKVARRTDIFALGLVLYQLVTGTHPFRGDNEFATLARIRDIRPADPPRTLVPSLPEELSQVVVTALAKDRTKRYTTMLDFARALEKAAPSPPDADRQLAAFMASILAPRAARKRQLLSDAIREVNARRGTNARPVNLSLFVPDDAEESAASRRIVPEPVAAAAAPAPAPPPAPAPLPAPAPAVPAVAVPDVTDAASFGAGEARRTLPLIAAGIAVAVLVVVVIWSVVSEGPGQLPPPAPSSEP
jgi:serine/threonine protein kinase